MPDRGGITRLRKRSGRAIARIGACIEGGVGAQKIGELYQSGLSVAAIARKLNEDGIPDSTWRALALPWSEARAVVGSFVKNRDYSGEVEGTARGMDSTRRRAHRNGRRVVLGSARRGNAAQR